MARYRKHSMASALAVAMGMLSLTACGGGGSSGGGIVTVPPPPPPPTIGAAATPAAPDASSFPQATAGGPTMQSHPETAFPLVQTAYTVSGSVGGGDVSATNGGATLTFDYPGAANDDVIELAVPGLGLDVDLVAGAGWYCYTYCGSAGDRYAESGFVDPGSSNLSWTTYGYWYSSTATTQTSAAYLTGYATPTGSVPTTGTASYNGSAQAQIFYPNGQGQNGIGHDYVNGDASLEANFGTRVINGNLTNMTNGSVPWNSVSLLGAISGGNFSGTTAATSAPGGASALSGSATGTFAGLFFGPAAEELGAVWTLSDGSKTVIGSIGAKTGP